MVVKLGEVFSIIRNGANIKQGVVDGGFPITRIETISERYVDRTKMGYAGIKQLEKYADYVMQDGDILMSHINSEKHLGKTAIYKKESEEVIIHGMNLLLLRPVNEMLLSKYAFYFLSSQAFLRQIPNITKKSVNQASFNITALKGLDFVLTSIDRQKEIVNSLEKVETIIALRKQQLQQLDELVKARFVEMFGDIITNSKKWDIMTWNDVLTIKNGRNQKQVENPNGEYPICGSGGIMSYADDYITNENSVIIGRKGNINKPILMRKKFWNVDTAFGLEPNTDILLVDYLYLYCLLFNFESLNKAVTIPSLTKSDLLNIDMPIPPIDQQNKFAIFVEQIDKSKFVVQKALDEAQLLFDSLMQEYFN